MKLDSICRHKVRPTACHLVYAALHPSADGPGEHQKAPLETSLGRSSGPRPRPIHQREETHPSDGGSGKLEAKGVPPTPLRTTNQTTEDTGP